MLRCSARRLAVGAYSLFMMEQKKNKFLKGLPVPERGRMTGKLYRALSPADREALVKRAAKMPRFKHHKKSTKPRKPNKYALFVKAQFHRKTFAKVPVKRRLKAIAKAWKEQRKTKVNTKKTLKKKNKKSR